MTDSRLTIVRGARQLLTMRSPSGPRRGADLGYLHIIEDGCVLIQNGRILQVGSSRRIENLAIARHATEVPAHGCVVMPGFVDADTSSLLAPTTHTRIPASRALAETERTLAAMAAYGTLAVETKVPDSRTARLLARIDSPVEVVPTLVAQALAPVRSRDRRSAAFVQGDLAGDSESDALVLARMEEARSIGLRMRASARAGAAAPLFDLARRGLAAAVDLRGMRREEITPLALFQTVAVLTPGAIFHAKRNDYPPARDMIACGTAVAIGTGYSPERNPTYSMPVAVGLACREMGLTPGEALAAATINGAWALGIQSRTGSLEPGKQADLLILSTPDYRAVAWEFGINLVSVTMRRGEIIYRAGSSQWKVR